MNRHIVVTAVVITAAGVVNAWVNKKPITTVVLGGYIFVIVLSLMDMFGGGLSTLSSALSVLAVTYVVLHEIPWDSMIALVQGKKK